MEVVSSEVLLVGLDDALGDLLDGGHLRTGGLLLGPGPCVAEPELGDDVKRCGLGSSIVGGDTYGDCIGVVLVFGVL